ASALGDVLAQALDRVRSAQPGGDLSRGDVQREVSRSVQEALSGGDPHADKVRSDVAMVLREIDAGGTVFRAAIEAGDEELEHEVLAAVGAVSAEFGELEFLLADLARAAGEIQDSLGGQGSELRTASEQVARQSADVRVIREELAAIEQRTRQWVPGSGRPGHGGPRWADGCPYRGLLPYEQAHETVFCGRGRLVATLAGTMAQAGLVMVTGASGAGKTSLLQAGLVPALARGVQVPGSSSWLRIGMTPGARPLTELSDRLAQLDDRDPAVTRKGLAGAPGDAHLLWDTATEQESGTALVAGAAEVGALAFSQDGKLLATGGQDGAVRLWDVATGSQVGTTMATGDAVSALTFGTGGTTLASAESDGATELWNVTTQTQTGAALTVQGSAGVSALAFSPAADALATGNGNGSIQLWNPAGYHQRSAPLALGSVGAAAAAAGHAPAAFSAGGGLLATSDGHGRVRVWNITMRRPAGLPMGTYHIVTGLALSPDGKTLAVAGSGVQL
ncbi:MAG TPA: hypothetical protein VJ254_02355, partial [Streptosporangiaceae bacterium]|nr:hypothetical protein [Streptosporangiaceae bacterium]